MAASSDPAEGRAPGWQHAVSIVVPAYNEELNVRRLYEGIRQALPRDVLEIIFVDDGSRDSTAERVRGLRAADPSVRLIRFGRNFGHQAALFAGLEAARGAAVITLDCDLQHPPELLGSMVDAWRDGASVVQMVRRQTVGVGVFKAAASRAFYRFINLLSEAPVTSNAADYQLLDRHVVMSVLQFRDRHPFLRGLVSWLGFPVTFIEYVAPARSAGKSGYSLRKMLRLSVHAVTGLSSKPLRAAFYGGLAAAVFCMIYAGFALVELFRGNTVPGWTSVFVMVTFLGAVQLVSIAILGEYIGRIYEQSRGMPRYVIVETTEADVPQAAAKSR
jgi:polyisoprenyl-phosphate glycosyltransferase